VGGRLRKLKNSETPLLDAIAHDGVVPESLAGRKYRIGPGSGQRVTAINVNPRAGMFSVGLLTHAGQRVEESQG